MRACACYSGLPGIYVFDRARVRICSIRDLMQAIQTRQLNFVERVSIRTDTAIGVVCDNPGIFNVIWAANVKFDFVIMVLLFIDIAVQVHT